MKIKEIEVKNFKAIDSQVANFNGCSAIITAGNDKGKTSLLRGIIDRFRGETPEIILKQGEEKGFNVMELTDGSRIEWKFTEKTESFAFITPDGIKMTSGVLKGIGEKYFGIKFDIDKFLNNSPKMQSNELGRLVGVDLTDINSRYQIAFDARKELKRDLDLIAKGVVEKPEKVAKTDMEALQSELADIKAKNEKTFDNWLESNHKINRETHEFNEKQNGLRGLLCKAEDEYKLLLTYREGFFAECINLEKAEEILNNMEEPKDKKIYVPMPEPIYLSTAEADQKIQDANFQAGKFESYEKDLKTYNDWVTSGTKARTVVERAEEVVKMIETEKAQMINNAKIPKEFKFTEDGILYNDFPLDSNQISSSGKYIAALKLGAMALGKIQAMHFDASFLDKNSLSEIQKWANDNELQLLIERPDFDCGEIKYEII